MGFRSTMDVVADVRECALCGTKFVPLREHARFCSARCRVTSNRQNATYPNGEETLQWAVLAMEQATERLQRAAASDPPHAFAVISEAVWRVTIADATMVRYERDTYDLLLTRDGAEERQATEDTLAGLRFVRNHLGHEGEHGDFIVPPRGISPAIASPVAEWTWKPALAPDLAAMPPRNQDWEIARYQAYQAGLVGRAVGSTFRHATSFIQRVSDRLRVT
jgi:hypothetical protein